MERTYLEWKHHQGHRWPKPEQQPCYYLYSGVLAPMMPSLGRKSYLRLAHRANWAGGSTQFLLDVKISLFFSSFVKRLISPLNGCRTFIKNHLAICQGLLLCSLFYLIGLSVCIYASFIHFGCCIFVISFNIRKHEFSNFGLCFHIVGIISGPLKFCMNFMIHILISQKEILSQKFVSISIGITLNI